MRAAPGGFTAARRRLEWRAEVKEKRRRKKRKLGLVAAYLEELTPCSTRNTQQKPEWMQQKRSEYAASQAEARESTTTVMVMKRFP